jgi:hypothetical protein
VQIMGDEQDAAAGFIPNGRPTDHGPGYSPGD